MNQHNVPSIDSSHNGNLKIISIYTIFSLYRANCSILLRVMLKTLATAAKETIEESNRPTVRLELWVKIMRIMESIVQILKIQTCRTNLIGFVKVKTINSLRYENVSSKKNKLYFRDLLLFYVFSLITV